MASTRGNVHDCAFLVHNGDRTVLGGADPAGNVPLREQLLGGLSAEVSGVRRRNPADLPAGTELPVEDPYAGSTGSMAELGFVFGLKLGTLYRRVSPEGWKRGYMTDLQPGQPEPAYLPDAIVWRFGNYKPESPLQATYISWVSLSFRAIAILGWDVCWARRREKKTCSKTRNRRSFLRSPATNPIRQAFCGTAGVVQSAKQDAESQLSESQRAVLNPLSAIADNEKVPSALSDVTP